MKEMFAYCGLPCHECEAFVAKRDNDDRRRAYTARLWSEKLGITIQVSDINCDGCLSDGKSLFRYCLSCEVRECARAREMINCAYCEQYTCAKLEGLFRMIPISQQRLVAIREAIYHSGFNSDL